jgi:hypothetical protein
VQKPGNDRVIATSELLEDLRDPDRMDDVRKAGSFPRLVDGRMCLGGEGESFLKAGVCLTCHLSP